MAKETVDQFAERIKNKYPEYKDKDNYDLVDRWLKKYPVYSDRVDFKPKAQKRSEGIPTVELDLAEEAAPKQPIKKVSESTREDVDKIRDFLNSDPNDTELHQQIAKRNIKEKKDDQFAGMSDQFQFDKATKPKELQQDVNPNIELRSVANKDAKSLIENARLVEIGNNIIGQKPTPDKYAEGSPEWLQAERESNKAFQAYSDHVAEEEEKKAKIQEKRKKLESAESFVRYYPKDLVFADEDDIKKEAKEISDNYGLSEEEALNVIDQRKQQLLNIKADKNENNIKKDLESQVLSQGGTFTPAQIDNKYHSMAISEAYNSMDDNEREAYPKAIELETLIKDNRDKNDPLVNAKIVKLQKEVGDLLDNPKMWFDPATGESIDKPTESAIAYNKQVKDQATKLAKTTTKDKLRTQMDKAYAKYMYAKDLYDDGQKYLTLPMMGNIAGAEDPQNIAVRQANNLKDIYIKAKQEFDAVSKAYLLNRDPSGVERGALKLGAEAFVRELVPSSLTPTGMLNNTNKQYLQSIQRVMSNANIEATEDQKERFKNTFTDNVSEGIGGIVGMTPKLMLGNAIIGEAEVLTGLDKALAILSKGDRIERGIALLGKGTLEEMKMQTIGMTPGVGFGFGVVGQMKGPKLSGKYGAILQPFVDKLLVGGVGGTIGQETGEIVKEAVDALNQKSDFKNKMDELFPNVSETAKRLIQELIVNSTIGVMHLRKQDITASPEKLVTIANELYSKGYRDEAAEVKKKADQIRGYEVMTNAEIDKKIAAGGVPGMEQRPVEKPKAGPAAPAKAEPTGPQPITKATYDFERAKPENTDKYDYYEQEGKYFKQLKTTTDATQERKVTEDRQQEYQQAPSRGVPTEAGGGDRTVQGREVTQEKVSDLTVDEEIYQPLPKVEEDKLREDITSGKPIAPIVVNESGRVLDGNNRLKVSQEEGIENIPVRRVPDTTTVEEAQAMTREAEMAMEKPVAEVKVTEEVKPTEAAKPAEEVVVREENIPLFTGENKVVTEATKTYDRVKVFKGDILSDLKEDAAKGNAEAIDILKNVNRDMFERANQYVYNKYKGKFDALKFENKGREGGEVPTEYFDLKEKRFYSVNKTHAKLYSLADRSKKYAVREANKIAEDLGFTHAAHLLNTINKGEGSKYERVQDVPKELLDKYSRKKPETASVLVAPYYDMSLDESMYTGDTRTVKERADAIRKTASYQRYIDNLKSLANALGLNVIEIEPTVGGFENAEGKKIIEVSTNLKVDGSDFEKVKLFSALSAIMAPERQESSIAGRYVEAGLEGIHNADEYAIEVGDVHQAVKYLKEAGIDNFTLNEPNKTIYILDIFQYRDPELFNKIDNFEQKLKDNNISYGKQDKRSIQSEYIGASERKDIISKAKGDAVQQRQDRTGILGILDEAQKRNDQFIREQQLKDERLEYNKLRDKQLSLQARGEELSPEELSRMTDLVNKLSPTIADTVESEAKSYTDAKAEIESVAKEVVGDLGFAVPFDIKRPKRAAVKILEWYRGNPNRLGDGARVNIIVKDPKDIELIFNKIRDKNKGAVLRYEPNATELGYPKKLLEVRTTNGKIAEFQVMTPEGYLAKDGAKMFDAESRAYAEEQLKKIHDRLGWNIPDGVGHYFYEVYRDSHVPEELRNQAKELSNKYYEAFLNPESKYTDAEFRKDVADFKAKVDAADKSTWNPGNEAKSPAELDKYLSEPAPEKVAEMATEPAPAKEMTEGEILNKNLEEAKDKFRRAGGLSSGGFEALPEFIDLVKAYVKVGIYNAKEFIEKLKLDYPGVKINEKKIAEKFDAISKQLKSESEQIEKNPVYFENAKKFADESSFKNKRDFKEALQNLVQDHIKELKKIYGVKFDPSKYDSTTKRYLVDSITKESLNALEAHPEAIGWYDEKTQKALDVMSTIHPEIATNEEARGAFILPLAIMSNGNQVDYNFELAEQQYRYYKENGRFNPEGEYGLQQSGIKKALMLMNSLLDNGLTIKDITEFLTSKYKAGDLKIRVNGKLKNLVSGELADQDVYGALIFGAKIGNGFYMNLWGQFDQLTMDRWFMRTWGRLTGTLIDENPKKISNGKTRLKEALNDVRANKDAMAIVKETIGKTSGLSAEELANAINKASTNKKLREKLMSNELTDELRKAGNNLVGAISGEKESPSGGGERKFIRDVFNDVVNNLEKDHGIKISMADLQAALWYPEKVLYESFKAGESFEDALDSYSEDTAPDYLNAAKKLAKKLGVTDERINESISGTRRSAERVKGEGYPGAGEGAGEASKAVLEKFKGVRTEAALKDAQNRVAKARKKFSDASRKSMQAGGFGALPEFAELVKAYINLGYVTAKDFIAKFKQDFPDLKMDDKELEDKFNEISSSPEQRYSDQEMTKMANAINDAYMANKFGVEALNAVMSQLKGTDMESVYNNVKEKIINGKIDDAKVIDNVIKNQSGSTEDQAVILYNMAKLKGQESEIQSKIDAETSKESPDKNTINELHKQKIDVQNKMMDNVLANKMIGRDWYGIGKLRQVWVDRDASLSNMMEQFKSSKGVKELSPEQEAEVRDAYNKIRELEGKIKKLEEESKAKFEKKKGKPITDEEKAKRRIKALEKVRDDLKKGIVKEAPEKPVETPEEKQLREEIRSIKEEMGLIPSKEMPKVPKADSERRLSALEKVLDDLRKGIVKEPSEKRAETEEERNMREEIRSIKEQMGLIPSKEMPKVPKTDVERRIAALEKVRDDLRKGIVKEPAEKRVETEEEKKLREEIRSIKEELGLIPSKEMPEAPISDLDKKVKRLEKILDDLRKGIVKEPAEKLPDTEIEKKLKEEIRKTKEEMGLIPSREVPESPMSDVDKKIKSINKQIDELNRRIAEKDYEKKERKYTPLEETPELKYARKQYNMARYEWEKARRMDMMANRPWYDKVRDSILGWQRFAVLSYPSTIAKLLAVVGHSIVIKPFKVAAQYIASRAMKAVSPQTAKMAGTWGTPTKRAVAAYYSEFIRNLAWKNLKNQLRGIDEAEIKYGNPYVYDEFPIAKGFMEIPGRAHGYIKSFIKRSEIAYAHELMIQRYAEMADSIEEKLKTATGKEKERLEELHKQYDLSNDANIEAINRLAVEHGRWSILMNDNKFVNGLNALIRTSGVAGSFIKTELPIVKIPTNFIGRAYAYQFNILNALIGKPKWSAEAHPGLIQLMIKGTKDITPREADLLSKSLTNGIIGVSLLSLGYVLSDQIEENEDGSYTIMGKNIGKTWIHLPEFESIFTGAKMAKEKGKDLNFLEKLLSIETDIAMKSPFANMLEYGFVAQMVQESMKKNKDVDESTRKVEKMIARKMVDMTVPGFIKESAKWESEDKPGYYRVRKTPQDEVYSAFPFLRDHLKEKPLPSPGQEFITIPKRPAKELSPIEQKIKEKREKMKLSPRYIRAKERREKRGK